MQQSSLKNNNNKKDIHVDVTAKVFQELDLTLAEKQAGLDRHGTVHGSVKTGQDLCLVLCHVSAVLEFQKV